jgi:hypothetical protein
MDNIYEGLFNTIKGIILAELKIDISLVRKEGSKEQNLVNARIIFIGVLNKYYEQEKYFPYKEIADFIHIDRSTVSIHRKKLRRDKYKWSISQTIKEMIDYIYILIKTDVKVLPTVKDLLLQHEQYLLSELETIKKLLIEYERTTN